MPNEPTSRELELIVQLDGTKIHAGRITLPTSKPTDTLPSTEPVARSESVVVFGMGLKVPPEGFVRVVLSLFCDPTCKPQVAFVQVDGRTQYGGKATFASVPSDGAKSLKNPLGHFAKTVYDALHRPFTPASSTVAIFDVFGRMVSHRELPDDIPPHLVTPTQPDAPPDDPHIVG